MANDWQKILDDFSGSNNTARPFTTSSPSASGASTNTKKKKDEDWQSILDDFSGSKKQTSSGSSQLSVSDRVHARTGEKKKEEEERKWFQKGLFEDGWQFGDVTKTILGSASDLLEDVGTGIIGLGEKAVDTLATIAPYAYQSQYYQNGGYLDLEQQKVVNQMTEQAKKDSAKFVAKDLYDEEKVAKAIIGAPVRSLGIDVEKSSVFGEKTDALAQSAGQLAATAGLQAVGVPWFITSGVASYGSEVESALNEGATNEEAMLSGVITAGAEILTEKISGGIKFGGKALDDVLTKQIARGVSNKTVRTLAKLGIDMSGEGAEEVLSGAMSAVGQKLTYADDAELSELFSSDEALESFIGGAVLGGGFGGINAIKSNSEGVDYVSGLSQNEQKVVEKVYQDRVAEAEKEGKISTLQKGKIYDSVLRDMENGYISTDTIEEVLDGEGYSAYNELVKEAEEYNTLYKTESGKLSEEQRDRLAELKEKNKAKPYEAEIQAARDKLSEGVFGLVQNDRLSESYNERSRRGQAYEADLSQYDAKQQEVIKKAVDSGVLNNTRRTHEFVDMVAKISADKGVLFDFTNNEKLKGSQFAVDGKTVNGFVTKDGVTLNVNSSKALDTVTGHEITHVLEGTELYTELQNAIFDYAKSKGEYDGRRTSLEALYKDIKDADIDAELTADLVGDYLFSDADFINRLSTEHRNVFQKIYDEIKYLCKVATAGSKEARELERVKRAFEKAYKADSKAQSDTKYSISDSTGKELTKEQQDYFKDSKVRDENGNLILVHHASPTAGFTVFDGSEGHGNYKYGEYGDGITFFTDNKAMAESYSPSNEKVDTTKLNSIAEAKSWLESIGADYLEVRENNGVYELYDSDEAEAVREYDYEEDLLRDIKRAVQEEYGDLYAGGRYDGYVNIKNPMVVDAEGRPWDRVAEEFSQEVYDKFMSLTSEEKAALEDLAGWEDASMFVREIRTAANTETQDEFTQALASAFNKLQDKDGYVNLFNLYDMASGGFTDEAIRESATVTLSTNDYVERALQAGTYDGVIIKNVIDYGGHAHATFSSPPGNDYIVFNSNQFKAADNTKPTDDADIRFSLSKPVEETKDLIAVHNLWPEKLLKSLKVGGLPMPSIAIAKEAHDEFGNISMIFRKETIDPKASKANKVYSGDAWTPTYPTIEYEASEEATARISSKVRELSAQLPEYYGRSIRSLTDYTNIEDNLNRWGGEQGLIEKFANDYGMKQLYLAEKGETVPVEIKRSETQISDTQKNLYQSVIDKMGLDVLNSYNDKGSFEKLGLAKEAWLEKHGEALKEAYAEDLASGGTLSKDEALEVLNGQSKFYWNGEINKVLAFAKNGGVTVKETEDISGTNAKIDEKISGSDYEQWLSNLFSGIEGQSGIRNNKDLFTPSGNRRSFSALHYAHTLENVVKAMKEAGTQGIGFGGGNIFGASATEYGSIKDIKADSDRLQKMSDEEYQALKDEFAERFRELAASLPIHKDSWTATEDAANMLVEAVVKGKTRNGIANYLRKESEGWANYSDSVVDDLIEIVSDIRNMPTGYFEAKPQRAVGFDEVAAIVIPYNADAKLKQELLNNGFSIAEYDPNVEGDRQRAVNQFEEYKFSLSNVGEQPSKYGNVHGKDIALRDTLLDIAPVATDTATVNPDTATVATDTTAQELFPDDIAPLEERKQAYNERVDAFRTKVDAADLENLPQQELDALFAEKDWLDAEAKAIQAEIDIDRERLESLDDADAPQEIDAPLPEERADLVPLTKKAVADIAKSVRSELALNNRQVSEVKSIIQKYAKTEFPSRDELYSEIEDSFGTIQDMETIEDIKEVKDFLRSYKINVSPDIQSDIADYSKLMRSNFGKIRFSKDGMAVDAAYQELSSMYPGSFPDDIINPTDQLLQIIDVANESHTAERLYEVDSETLDKVTDLIINGVNEYKQNQKLKDAEKDAKAAFDALVANADEYAPVVKENPTTQDIAPVKPVERKSVREEVAATKEAPKDGKTAKIMREVNKLPREGRNMGLKAVTNFVDKGMVFENLSHETGNMELQAKYDYALPSKAEARAQEFMKNGTKGVKSLDTIRKEVGQNEQQFQNYLYHLHNIDRMTLDERFGVENKAVYGDSVTADVSREEVKQYEAAHPEFKRFARDVYKFNEHLRKLLVDNSVISQETADLWQKMYPHYVPIHRVDVDGVNISVPLDTRKTGVNNPVKRATGGNSDIQPLFNTMAERAMQTYKAIARNSFGIELKNTLGSTITQDKAALDEVIDSIGTQDELLKAGKLGMNPTFTVFENGERVEFEITEDMFDALKPTSPGLAYTNKTLNKISEVRRNTLTSWNPVFALYRNPVKDIQDVVINSQHPARTYANVPRAIFDLATGGKYATEYYEHGGRQNTYYDKENNRFDVKDSILKKITGLGSLEKAGNFIETVPRLAEFIASRNEGRSIERSMLDAARVTTNFAAGGDYTKFLNRHGVTFLNASVQGASQHVRNFREAKMNGLKGWVQLAAKYTVAGLPAILLNNLLWEDDEDYEELSEYVKDSYYVIAKTEDGKFIRIPKGRTAAVIQDGLEQIGNTLSGDAEADWENFFQLFMSNIAPNNPIENNILAPVIQTLQNKTWYGDDLVPSRLAKLPAEEQFDESTDAISRQIGEWLADTPFEVSPVKLNYLIDQYSGGFGDMFLPMLTPEAESGDDSFIGNVIAPWKKEMSTDSVLNNRYPGEFYDLRDELEVNANARGATEEDRLKSLYLDEVGWEMSDLYAEKREIQNSDLSDSEKYEAIREVQSEINALAENALRGHNYVLHEGLYAEVGDKRFDYNEENGKWYEITQQNYDGSDNWYYQKEQEVTKGLGISYSEYWNNREEYNYAYDNPGKYAIAQAVGGYDSYMEHYDVLENWKSPNYLAADKDEKGESISGSRKKKVMDYINGLDLDYGEKIILFRTQYSSKADKKAYNMDIVNYLNSREDIDYNQMKNILEELGMTVDDEGYITW